MQYQYHQKMVSLVFAYPFHFGKSGFLAYFFTPNPDIWIFCAGPYRPLYTPVLFS